MEGLAGVHEIYKIGYPRLRRRANPNAIDVISESDRALTLAHTNPISVKIARQGSEGSQIARESSHAEEDTLQCFEIKRTQTHLRGRRVGSLGGGLFLSLPSFILLFNTHEDELPSGRIKDALQSIPEDDAVHPFVRM